MPFHAIRNGEPADAREALLQKYYSSRNTKKTQSSAVPDYRNTNSQSLRPYPGRSSQSPHYSVSPAPSPSPYSPPSLVFSPATSRSVSPISPDLDISAPNPVILSKVPVQEDLSSDAYVREFQRVNRQKIEQYRQLSLPKLPAPRFPEGGFQIPVFVNEQHVEYVLEYWDRGLSYVPNEDIYNGIRAFEAGVPIDKMDLDHCAALVHVLATAINEGYLVYEYATPEQITNYLYVFHEAVKRKPEYWSTTIPFKKEHWLLGTMRDRVHEIKWLGVQAETLFWTRHNKGIQASYERLLEPSDQVLAVLFDTYIQGYEGYSG